MELISLIPPLPLISLESPLKKPEDNPKTLCQIPLTHNSPFCIFNPNQSELLSLILNLHSAFRRPVNP